MLYTFLFVYALFFVYFFVAEPYTYQLENILQTVGYEVQHVAQLSQSDVQFMQLHAQESLFDIIWNKTSIQRALIQLFILYVIIALIFYIVATLAVYGVYRFSKQRFDFKDKRFMLIALHVLKWTGVIILFRIVMTLFGLYRIVMTLLGLYRVSSNAQYSAIIVHDVLLYLIILFASISFVRFFLQDINVKKKKRSFFILRNMWLFVLLQIVLFVVLNFIQQMLSMIHTVLGLLFSFIMYALFYYFWYYQIIMVISFLEEEKNE